LLLIDQCAAYQKNVTFLSNIKVIFLPATAFILGNHPCIQMLLQKAADFEDCSHGRWGTAARYYTDEAQCVVCNALHSRTLNTYSTYYNKELLCEV
jgi:hypothetical protein